MIRQATLTILAAATLASCAQREPDYCKVRSYRTAAKAVEDMQKLPNRSPAMEAMAYQNQLNDCVDLEAAALRRSHDPAELVAHVVVTECQGFINMPRLAFVQEKISSHDQTGATIPSQDAMEAAFADDLYKNTLVRVVAWRAKDCSKLEES